MLAASMPGISPYQYAYNNPVMLNDPTGQSPVAIGMAVGAVAGGIAGGIIAQRNGHDFWHGFAVGAVAGAAIGATAGYLAGGAGAPTATTGIDPWARVADPLVARGTGGAAAAGASGGAAAAGGNLAATLQAGPKPNVMLVTLSKKEIAAKFALTLTRRAIAHHGQWHVIMATNLIDGNRQVGNYLGGSRADNLVVFGHGSNSFNFSQIDPNADVEGDGLIAEVVNRYAQEPTASNIPPVSKPYLDALSSLMNKVADNGNLIMAHCYAGSGSQGQVMSSALHIISGGRFHLYMNQDYSTIHSVKGYGLAVGPTNENPTGGITMPDKLVRGWIRINPNGKTISVKSLNPRRYNGNLIINTRARPPIGFGLR